MAERVRRRLLGRAYTPPMHAQRGKLLFRVNADQQLQRYIWAGVAIILAASFAYQGHREHRLDWGTVIFFVGCCLSFLLSRKVIFYKNGIYFPQDPTGTRARFIAWQQIERFHWDGDVLTVVPALSLLGGAGSFSGPNTGGSVRVPTGRRVQVENLLSAIQTERI
jgi:hypothetical protein